MKSRKGRGNEETIKRKETKKPRNEETKGQRTFGGNEAEARPGR